MPRRLSMYSWLVEQRVTRRFQRSDMNYTKSSINSAYNFQTPIDVSVRHPPHWPKEYIQLSKALKFSFLCLLLSLLLVSSRKHHIQLNRVDRLTHFEPRITHLLLFFWCHISDCQTVFVGRHSLGWAKKVHQSNVHLICAMITMENPANRSLTKIEILMGSSKLPRVTLLTANRDWQRSSIESFGTGGKNKCPHQIVDHADHSV